MCLCLEAKRNETSGVHIHQFAFPENRVAVFKLPPGTRWSSMSLFTTADPGLKGMESCRLGNVRNGVHAGSLMQ